jgi:type I restriction enzyme, S subunit
MAVRPGYKQTEVGVIPEDWAVKPLSSVVAYTNGKAHEGFISDFGEYIVVNSKFISTSGEVKKYSSQCFSPTSKGEILMVMSDVPNGKAITRCFLVDQDNFYTVNQRICALRPLQVDGRFLFYKLDRNPYYLTFDDGVKQTNLRKDDVLSCPLALPPTTAEQEAIAETLSDADAFIESLEQLIAKKRHLKQGAMQELLRPGKGWVTTKLGSFGVFLKGSGVRKDESMSGELPCIRYGEIYTKHSDYIKLFHSWISREVATTAKRLRCGDLLFAGSGETKEEIGKCVAFVGDFEAYAGGDIVILRPENVSSVFMGYYLNTNPINRQKASKGQGDAIVHIGVSALAGIDITIPPLEEQTAIAAILSDMDAEIIALESKLAKARQLKQGMMHNLLTGKIRLI